MVLGSCARDPTVGIKILQPGPTIPKARGGARPVAPAALAVAGTALLAVVVTALVRARRG